MKFTFLLWLSFFGGFSAAVVDPNISSQKICAAANHSCAIMGGEVRCWGYNGFGELNVPELKNVKQISCGFGHTCALDEQGVKCWGGMNSKGETTVPALKNPRQVNCGAYLSCALDDVGVRCWGYNNEGQLNVPKLKNPSQVFAGYWHACALDEGEIKCWGKMTNVPKLNKPKHLANGVYDSCAVEEDGTVKCWELDGEISFEIFADLGKAYTVEMNKSAGLHQCGIDLLGAIKCFGMNSKGQTDVPSDIVGAKEVSVGSFHTCALTASGVRCWGDNTYGQTDVPNR